MGYFLKKDEINGLCNVNTSKEVFLKINHSDYLISSNLMEAAFRIF